MKRIASAVLWILASLIPVCAQSFPTPVYFRELVSRRAIPNGIPGPISFSDYIVDDKLNLSLRDAVRLALENNTEIRIEKTNYELTHYNIVAAHSPFDPVLTSSFAPRRSFSPSISTLTGAETLSQLSQTTSSAFSQTLQTGTTIGISFDTSRSTTNSTYTFVNPSFASGLNFRISQPLLRNRGLLPNRAQIIIARSARSQSRSVLDEQVSNILANTVTQYWNVVQSRENLKVLRKSLELAEATFKQNKRALELGALPPLDIYRSEAQVAQRRVAIIESEAQLKQVEDQLRTLIGVDLDPTAQDLEMNLTERADISSRGPVDIQDAVSSALRDRPELVAARQRLSMDDLSIRVANQNLKPDLSLSAFYASNGVGGTVLDSATGTIVSRGGFGDSWRQLTGFSYPSYGASLELRLPLRNSSAEASLGTAVTTKRHDLYLLRLKEQQIALQVRNAVHQLEGSGQAIVAAQNALELAKKNLGAEQRKYELGAQTIFFVLDAQTQLATAEQSLLQAQIRYQNANTAFDVATGGILGRYRVTAGVP